MQLFRNRWIPLVTLLLFLSACSSLGPGESPAPRELPPDASAGEIHNAFLEEILRTPQLRDPGQYRKGLETAFVSFGRSLELSEEDSRLAFKATSMALDSLIRAGAKPFSTRLADQLDMLRLASREGWLHEDEAATMGNWLKRLDAAENPAELERLLHERLPLEAHSPRLLEALDVGQHSWDFWSGAVPPPVGEEASYEEILDALEEFQLQQEIMQADITGQLITGVLVGLLIGYAGPVGVGAHVFLTVVAPQMGAAVVSSIAAEITLNPPGNTGHGVGWHGEGHCH